MWAWLPGPGELALFAAAVAVLNATPGVDFLLTNLLNPKVALFFLAFLPQFVPDTTPGKTAVLLLLGAWFALQGTLFLLLLVLLSARRALATLGGGLFVALALRLLGARPAPG